MKIRTGLAPLGAALLAACASASARAAESGDVTGTMKAGAVERTYRLHVPPSPAGRAPLPLVLALHGRLGTGAGQARLSHLDAVSDRHGFLVVYPDGLERSWADGRGVTPADQRGVDDVRFLAALVDEVDRRHPVDRARVYSTGMSNGGFMSARLACELADRVSAVAIVAASISEATARACRPSGPVSVAVLEGTEDPLVPYRGGAMGRSGDRGTVLSLEATARFFRDRARCTATVQREHMPDRAGDGTTVDVEIYPECDGGAEVRSYTIRGGGHTWPGGEAYLPAMMVGKTSGNLDASEAIWAFFSRHRTDSSSPPASAGGEAGGGGHRPADE